MAAPIRRPGDAVDAEAIVRLYPPAPEFFAGRWLDEPDRLRALQLARLKDELERAARIPFYRRLWERAGFEASSVRSLADMRAIPLYTIEEIRDSIERCPPLGDYQGIGLGEAVREPMRLFFSGGTTGAARPTLYTMWDREVGALLTARAYYLAGLRRGDVVLNSWAYGIHQGAAIADEALFRWLGAVPITTSSGQVTPTARQLELAAEYRAASILTIGDYLLHMAEVARGMGLDPKEDFAFRCFPVPTGGLRERIEETWGAPAFDSYGFHEVNYVGVECPARGGLHVLEDAFIVEIVDDETGELLPEGELGNVVVTCLYKTGSAQVRYNTKDRSRLLPIGQCACGSWMRKMDYFQGRSDNMVKLRGTNVWPEAVGMVATACDGVTSEYFVRVENVGGRDEMTVQLESVIDRRSDAAAVAEQVEKVLRSKLGVGIRVELVPVGALAEVTGRATRSKPIRFEDRRARR